MKSAIKTSLKHAGTVRNWPAESDRKRLREAALEAAKPDDKGAQGEASTTRGIRTESVEVDGKPAYARRVVCECQMDALYHRERVSLAQYQAGLWFRGQYLLGYQSAVVTAGYGERVSGSVGEGVSARVIDARHNLEQLAQLLGLMEWAAVEGAAGHDQQLGKGRLLFLKAGLDLVALYRDTARADNSSKNTTC